MNTLPLYNRNGSLLVAVLPLLRDYLTPKALLSIAMAKKDWLWPALSLLLERVHIRSIQHYRLFINTPHLLLLRHLDMSNVPESFAVSMDRPWLVHLFLNAKHLQTLNLSNCPLITDIEKLPEIQLKHLNLCLNQNLSHRDLSQLLQACPCLETLDLSEVNMINDDTLTLVAEHCQNLSHFSLKNAYVTLQGMSRVLSQCQKLTRLSLKECSKLQGSFLIYHHAAIRSLKTLVLNRCPFIKMEHLNGFMNELESHHKKDAASARMVHLDLSENHQMGLNAAVLERMASAFPDLQRLKISYTMLPSTDSIDQYCTGFSRFKKLECLIMNGLQETVSADLIWKVACSLPRIRSIILYRDSDERDFITTRLYADANLRGNAVDDYFVKSFNDSHGKSGHHASPFGIHMELKRSRLLC
jgi:hypothetical protein